MKASVEIKHFNIGFEIVDKVAIEVWQIGSNKMKHSSKKKDLRKTVKNLEEKLALEEEKAKGYLNSLKYLQADFENYRKRIEKEVQGVVQRSNEKLIIHLVDIMDDLEKAIEAGENTKNKEAILEGVKMVHKNFEKVLETEGLQKLECVGKCFDPNLHEILSQIPTKDYQSGTILEEARKGFMFRGKVLRPSVVKIACEVSEGNRNE